MEIPIAIFSSVDNTPNQKYFIIGIQAHCERHSANELCLVALTSKLFWSIGISTSGGLILKATMGPMNTTHTLSNVMFPQIGG